ncbi:SGNH/GDSL hydrolase family protein [Paenibacillus sp.]|uniref:SGNH/GDSL hydrolase family protein n=1 Tax=Paenibacillus sp. TaxID=58172 RepID=UPI0028111D28|nr:SGNH/GDSL hydrolase family protein [Paenibacillus sp.]
MKTATIALQTMEKMARGEHAVIVMLGDSITEPNYHVHGHMNYAGLLHERLLEKFGRHLLAVNAGVSGNTAQNLINRLERDVLRFTPDLVTIMIGINDCGAAVPLEEYAADLERLIRSIRGQGAEVLLMTPHPLMKEDSDVASKYTTYRQYITEIREVSRNLQVPLCDIYEAWGTLVDPGTHSTLMNDFLHPNELGHRVIADVVFRSLGI